MRSLLFVPADSPRKLERAWDAGADALIIDLEDSVEAAAKETARRAALAYLTERSTAKTLPRLYVRINGLATGLSEGDLDTVMTGRPDGIVLPKATGGADIALLDSRLAVREALHGLAEGTTEIIAIATESGAAIFGLGSYAGASPRLAALSWGAEDLSAAIGASANRAEGDWTEPFRIARSLTLFAAAAADVAAIDTVYTDFRNLDGLRDDCEIAVRDGFSGRLAIHPDQVPIINEIFTPSEAAIEEAEQITAAFAQAGGAGVISVEGRMLDRPHLLAAQRLLKNAGQA